MVCGTPKLRFSVERVASLPFGLQDVPERRGQAVKVETPRVETWSQTEVAVCDITSGGFAPAALLLVPFKAPKWIPTPKNFAPTVSSHGFLGHFLNPTNLLPTKKSKTGDQKTGAKCPPDPQEDRLQPRQGPLGAVRGGRRESGWAGGLESGWVQLKRGGEVERGAKEVRKGG